MAKRLHRDLPLAHPPARALRHHAVAQRRQAQRPIRLSGRRPRGRHAVQDHQQLPVLAHHLQI